MKARLTHTWAALRHFWIQNFLAVDQLLNSLLLGALAVAMALVTGQHQDVAYADETLSAHAYRAQVRGRRWGRLFMPIIDFAFRWQGWHDHCRRAYQTEKEKRGLPIDYRN